MGRMPKKYHIRLEEEERVLLESITRKGRASAQRQRAARILLLADANQKEGAMGDEEIARVAQTTVRTVERVRQSCVEEGLSAALERKPRPPSQTRKLDGRSEAHLVALSCGPAPAGRARWTLRLLAGRLVELEVVEEISHETVRRTLKKTSSNPGRKGSG